MMEQPFKLETTLDRILFCLNHGSVQIMSGLWVMGLVITTLTYSPWSLAAILFGLCFQYGNEYFLHRFIYHQEAPQDDQDMFNTLYSSHYGHHDLPNNPKMWLGTSLWYAPRFAVIAFVIQAFVLWLAGVPIWWQLAATSVFCGSITTYLFYEWSHTTAHAQGKKNWLERYITTCHAKHHFHDWDSNYHVSAGGILVDMAGGTAFQKDVVKAKHAEGRLKFIRTLGLEPDDERLVTARAKFAERFSISPASQEAAKR